MPRLVRSSLLIVCLSLPVAVLLVTAQSAPPLFSSHDDGASGAPTEFVELAADEDEVRARIDANQSVTGDYTEEFKLAAIQEVERQQQQYPLHAAGAAAPSGVATWRSLGPTQAKYQTNGVTLQVSDSGRIRTILTHPTDPNVVYLLTSGGGLWKTTTFTHQHPLWEAKTDALLSTSGGSVAFGRTPDTLYLGIGDPFDVRALIAGVMVKSIDGGATWRPMASLSGAGSIRDVKVDTSGPADVVLVATNAGLFRSADGGATYSKIVATIGTRGIWSLARTAAGWLVSVQNDSGNFSGPGFLFHSEDQGATWSPIPNGGNGFSGAGRTTLAAATPGDPIVYAYAGNTAGSAQRDLFRSVDGGLNWAALNVTGKTPVNPNADQPTMNIMGGQAFYNQLILVDPLDASRNTVFIGGQLSTAKTSDGGATWTILSNWLPRGLNLASPESIYVHADHHAAAFSSLGGQNTLFFGTDGGVFISTDAGATWSDDKNDGIVAFLANTIAVSTKNTQNHIIGLQDTGSRARLGASSVYNQVVGGDGEGAGWSQANNAVTLASVQNMGIRRSPGLLPNTNGSFRRATTGIGGLDFYPFFTNIETPRAVADPTGLQFVSNTGWRIYKTSNGAASWQVIGEAGVSPGLRAKTVGASFVQVFRLTHHNIGISPLDTDHIAVGETSGRMAFTADGGAHWTERNINALVPGFNSSTTSPAWGTNAKLYLASESTSANPNTVRLAKSVDGGVTWAAAQRGLPRVPVNRLITDPRDVSGDTVYAATWIGVYRTTDGGANWTLLGAGLPRVEVSDLYLEPGGKFLRVSTYGRGVWEIVP